MLACSEGAQASLEPWGRYSCVVARSWSRQLLKCPTLLLGKLIRSRPWAWIVGLERNHGSDPLLKFAVQRGRIGQSERLGLMAIRTSLSLAMGIMLASSASTSYAGLVTWHFSGELVHVTPEFNVFPETIESGTPFSGTFTFDTGTPDADMDNPRIGLYPDSVTAVSGLLGEMPFAASELLASEWFVRDVAVGQDNDSFTVSISGVQLPIIDGLFRLDIFVADANGSMLSDDGLPLHPPDMTALDVRSRADFLWDPGPGSAGGPINVLIPEPSTLALLIFGAAGCLVRRNRDGWHAHACVSMFAGRHIPHNHAAERTRTSTPFGTGS